MVQYKNEEPKMTTEQVRLMNGVLLGRGTIDKNRSVIRRRWHGDGGEEYLRGLSEEFSNVGGRVVKIKNGLEFRTGRFDWVQKWYKVWYYKERKVIPPKLSLSPEMAGLWHYERGSVDSYDRVVLDMDRMERSIINGRKALKRAGYKTFESFKRIGMIKRVSEEFLEWMEFPPIDP